MTKNDYVVILHGIARTRRHMRKLETYLSKQGYEVCNLNYPSTKQSLEQLVDTTWQIICEQLTENKSIHFVGYSMGGLIVRAMLSKYRPQQLGKIVLLGTPNKGSEVADFLKNFWLYKKIWGPAGQQLITDQQATAHLFSRIDYEVGIIAGNRPIDLVSSTIIGKPNDGKVSIDSTKLDGMVDHIVLPVNHTWFPHNKLVQQQTAHFLQHGKFNHSAHT